MSGYGGTKSSLLGGSNLGRKSLAKVSDLGEPTPSLNHRSNSRGDAKEDRPDIMSHDNVYLAQSSSPQKPLLHVSSAPE